MNRPTISTIKTKIKTHAPEIVVTAVTLVGVGAALYFATKSTPATNAVKREDVGPILVLEEVDADNNIYTDLDYPGVMYQVTVVS